MYVQIQTRNLSAFHYLVLMEAVCTPECGSCPIVPLEMSCDYERHLQNSVPYSLSTY